MKASASPSSPQPLSEPNPDDSAGNRRTFIRSLAQRVARAVPGPFLGASLASFHTAEEATSDDEQWIPAAPVHTLSTGAPVKFSSPFGEIEIRSTELGYRAYLSSGQTVALRSGRLGWVEVNPALHWLSANYLSNENLEMKIEPSDLQGEKND